MKVYYSNLNLVASTYGSGSYDSATYNGQAATGTGSGSGSNALTNTGVMVAGVVTLAALILLVAMVVRIWRRPTKQATEAVPVEEVDSPNR